jgi:hypothetical protein
MGLSVGDKMEPGESLKLHLQLNVTFKARFTLRPGIPQMQGIYQPAARILPP